MIYLFSSQHGKDSYHLSSQFIQVFKEKVENTPILKSELKERFISKPSFYLRKLAHLTIFALLGMATRIAVGYKSKSRLTGMIIALLICSFYALLDEWHQYYIPGRSAQLIDVVIDMIGASLGIIVVECMTSLLSSIKNMKKFI